MPSDQPARRSGDHPAPIEMRIPARQIQPGDYLPPQAVLGGTSHEVNGFIVGSEDGDVLPGLAVVPGHMQLYCPSGTLDSVAHEQKVDVRRCLPTPTDDKEKFAP
jgi:hypothetical protein